MNTNIQKPFRVLCLDGGGSKGVYTLGVLKEVEALAARPLCEVFDLIYGTSTGAIIATLIALGYKVSEIEKLYFRLIPKVMGNPTRAGRSAALRVEAETIFGKHSIADFKTAIGVVSTNHDRERPMVFKNLLKQAHGRKATFVPFFGASITDAIVSSCAAFPFFEMVVVKTTNQGDQVVMDGGFVANNPTLFALADAREAFQKNDTEVFVLSVGVGQYNEPKRSAFHKILFWFWPIRLIPKMFNLSSKTIEQVRLLLFPKVICVRIDEAFPQPEYATDLLEDDLTKLKTLFALGRDSFAKAESDVRLKLQIPLKKMNWEPNFTKWAHGPGKTEQDRCENAESAIRQAVATHTRLSSLDISVFAQGSYANRTNVRQDSDVDICVRLDGIFLSDYPAGKAHEDYGNTDGGITFSEFKNLVGEALIAHFGSVAVTRGNKAFDIKATRHRVNADVLPAMEYREYFENVSYYREGIAFIPDNNHWKTTNYPKQHLENGRTKHERTARRFKKIIRILKCLRNQMQDEKVAAAQDVASCLIEHLVWNVPDSQFNGLTLTGDVRAVLAYVFNNTRKDEECAKWCEVNDIKYIFHASQPWTRQEAHSFISAAWDYLGFQ